MRVKLPFAVLVLLLVVALAHAFHSLQVVDHAQQVEQNCHSLAGEAYIHYYTGRAYWLHANVNCVVAPDHRLASTTFAL